jgi:N-acetylglucosamine repressor
VDRRAQPNLLRQLNERTVFELVRRRGQTSRADLKRVMGVSAPTVSKAVASLLDAGYLEEVGVAPATGAGRPVMVYRLGRGKVQVLGATIAPRRCTVVAAGLDGAIDESRVAEFDTPATYDELLKLLADQVKRLTRAKGVTTLGLGLCAPGVLDVRDQRVLISPNLHLLDSRSPARDLRQKLDLDVVLFHDTVGVCLAEQQSGAARDMHDFVHVGAGIGFGASVVSGGRLIAGSRGMAGELGHITVEPEGERCGCGNRGCLETVATEAAFARSLSKRLGRQVEIGDALELARDADPAARQELDRALGYLAIAVATAVNVFNPEAVLVSSRMLGLPDAFDRFVALTTERAMKPLLNGCRILPVTPKARQAPIAAIIHHLTNSLGPSIA